jgi:6-phosphofructokinase
MNALILQCGGPTAVVNASLAAVIERSQSGSPLKHLWGARLGVQGLVTGDWAELSGVSAPHLAQLYRQPGAALGSSRYFLADGDVPTVLGHLARHQIGALFFIGGNGTMAAAAKVERAAQAQGYQVDGQPLQVIGIPKTVDNDLTGTDAAPGYGSAARWIAQTVRDIGLDLQTMRVFDDVVVLEVMGRHAGWLAAASALARQAAGDPPDLILLPEVVFAEAAFLDAVQTIHRRKGICLVVASEGIRDAAGNFVAEQLGRTEADGSGQKFLGLAPGVAPYLATRVRAALGLRCRHIRPDTVQRSSSALVSDIDRRLAQQVGFAAVDAVHAGHTGVMIGLVRQLQGWTTKPVPFAEIAGQERLLPATFYAPERWDVTASFVDYARPLVGELWIDRVQL